MPETPSHDSCKFDKDELGVTRTRIPRYRHRPLEFCLVHSV